MPADWLIDLIGIIAIVIMLISIYFIHKKSRPRIDYEEEIKRFNNSPIMYSFFMFSVCFLTVNIFIDYLSIFIESYKFNISFKYGIPLFAAYCSYFRFKRLLKLKKQRKNALTTQ
jgi:multisubunit Na+/H+ antiporter MnhB subunit